MFSATLANPALLFRLLTCLQKSDKLAVIRLTVPKVSFIVTSTSTDGVHIWAGVDSPTLFEDYVLGEPSVFLEVDLAYLTRALKSAHTGAIVSTAVQLVIRESQPFLSFQSVRERGSAMPSVVHDVPCSVLSTDAAAHLVEPALPPPQVQIMLPPLKSLRTAIAHMKSIGSQLAIHGNMDGDLTFRVQADMVAVAAHYHNLEHPQVEGFHRDATQVAAAKVDIKKFMLCLASSRVSPSDVICCIIEGRCVVLYAMLDDLYITYYIPVIHL
eukprot:gnl/Spiro4/1577_TR834_c0_g1_i1.p1 gnl/Spiro4/1577_TR834_c0_g1~~gnl/Spiro4/1577_TR834_c0_g1_i1.p1  ORF type:complete len:270 (-),score=52.35 gnl/Spiro4/1577_TR834_c0_g1_i1:217-1026(-)